MSEPKAPHLRPPRLYPALIALLAALAVLSLAFVRDGTGSNWLHWPDVTLALFSAFLSGALARKSQRLRGLAVLATRAMHGSEAKFHHLFDQSPFGLFLLGPDGSLKDSNWVFESMAGASRDKIVGSNMLREAQGAALAPCIREALTGKRTSIETPYTSTAGNQLGEYRFVFQPIMAGGEITDVLAFVEDISERRQTEIALNKSHEELENRVAERTRELTVAEAQFRGLVEQSLVGIYIIQGDRFVYVNPTFAEIFGYAPEEILALPGISELVVPEDRETVTRNIGKRLQGEVDSIRYAFKGIRKDGKTIHVEVHGKRSEHAGQPAVIGVLLDVTEHRQAEVQLNQLAFYDALTGLPNRTLFMDHLKLAMAGAKLRNTLMALLILDLDHFKEINDTLGHHIGDQLLQGVAARIAVCVRDTDTVARFGGDEFAIIQTDVAGIESVETLAQTIIDAVASPFLLNGAEIYTGVSIGVTVYPLEDVSAEQLLQNADMAMYAAKNQGRNNFQFFSVAMNVEAHSHMALQNGLRLALEHDELMLFYQPKINLTSGRIVGAEALLRWRHPERGYIPPVEFIPVAEDSGLIVPIGEQALQRACRQNKAWQAAGLPPICVSVNLSPVQFKRQNLTETVTRALREADLAPHYLELEITESLLMENRQGMLETLEWCRQLGVHVSIDDFGTGYSSLSDLKRLPVDILKIDRSFISDIPGDSDDVAIARAIIGLSHHLNLKVIAEGVETLDQASFLSDNGCDEVQGYYFSKPLPAEEFEALLASGKTFGLLQS